MRNSLHVLIVMVLGLGNASAVLAAQGPVQSPLKVTAIYMSDGIGAVYVQFQPDSMPGCYNTSGGYLLPTNSYFKELYAQILAIVASGGVRAAVLYTQNTVTNNWGDCTITGIYLVPE
jgi:hypothetical protein